MGRRGLGRRKMGRGRLSEVSVRAPGWAVRTSTLPHPKRRTAPYSKFLGPPPRVSKGNRRCPVRLVVRDVNGRTNPLSFSQIPRSRTPSGCRSFLGGGQPGVFASLDPRLMSVTPLGVDGRDCVAVLYGGVLCCAVRSGAVRCEVVLCGAKWCCAVRSGFVLCDWFAVPCGSPGLWIGRRLRPHGKTADGAVLQVGAVEQVFQPVRQKGAGVTRPRSSLKPTFDRNMPRMGLQTLAGGRAKRYPRSRAPTTPWHPEEGA
jgi:hypothetical protein